MSTPFRRQGLQDSLFADSPLDAQSIADYSDAHRLRLVDRHQDSNAGQRRAYVAALNEVAGKHLLPQERQFLARFNQSQPQTTCHSWPPAGPPPDRSPPGTPSTTLADMNLEQRAQQIPRHSVKIPPPPRSYTRHDERLPRGVAGGSPGTAAARVQEVDPLLSSSSAPSSFFFFSENDNGSGAFYRPGQLQQPEQSSTRDATRDDHKDARAQLEHLTQELISAQSSYKKHAQALVDVDAEIKHLSACVLRLTFQDNHHQ
ncbi:hypothetical protein LY76DRAFT_674867 [Colletotrichum caudatum]|nr:hypothetical protein LY76DRAFT_674867 [Colletotrichum caudatum]